MLSFYYEDFLCLLDCLGQRSGHPNGLRCPLRMRFHMLTERFADRRALTA